MVRPGARNLITDVPGILIGNAEDARALTGVTVILAEAAAVAGYDIRGGAPGTRETDALDPTCLVGAVDAVVLSGGSVYGLDAASGVVEALGEAGRGFAIQGSPRKAPIVPAAILFDLSNGGDKSWTEAPYRALGRAAFANVGQDFQLGNSGAGLGARAGDLKGGLGSASAENEEGLVVGALIAVNAVGSALVPGTTCLWAATFEQAREMGGQVLPTAPIGLDWPPDTKAPPGAVPGGNTTIGVIATNAVLSPAEAKRIAIMAHDGFARALRPVHTPMDGDALFVLATGRKVLHAERRPLALAMLGMMAADCATRAIGRAIYEAASIGGMVSYRERLRSG
jgi:L-aminopeptidase/D-esterase-like protein